jgi:hypothetical protein
MIIMKKLLLILLLSASSMIFGQFKGDENKPINVREGILNNNSFGSIFGFVDPTKFNMNHSFEMSYSAFGNNGMALGIYTNKLAYEFSEEFDIQVNTSFVNSPYNTLGENFTNSINGVYIDNARINYRPSDKFKISLQFSNSPFNYYNRYSYGRYSPFARDWFDD